MRVENQPNAKPLLDLLARGFTVAGLDQIKQDLQERQLDKDPCLFLLQDRNTQQKFEGLPDYHAANLKLGDSEETIAPTEILTEMEDWSVSPNCVAMFIRAENEPESKLLDELTAAIMEPTHVLHDLVHAAYCKRMDEAVIAVKPDAVKPSAAVAMEFD